MKLINVTRSLAALAFAASLTTGWMAVAYAQDPASTTEPGGDCPFADTEHASCRDGSTTVDEAVAESSAQPTKPELVVICHRPGTPAQRTLFVAAQATPAHMDHGDTPGPCGDF